jgi:transposase-like protein
MTTIRYSQAFKIHLVKEVERGELPLTWIARKYGVRSHATLIGWVRRWGNGKHGKVIHVQKPEELSELARLRRELKQAKEALANAYIDRALDEALIDMLAEKAGVEDIGAFKKKHGGKGRIER